MGTTTIHAIIAYIRNKTERQRDRRTDTDRQTDRQSDREKRKLW